MQEETIVHNKIDEMVLTVPLGNSTTVEIVESLEKVLSVKEVCKIANISRKTLFYYDKIGLLLPKRRVGSQHTKMYDKYAINRLQQIQMYKNAGLLLREIREILNDSKEHAYKYLQKANVRLTNEQEKIKIQKENLEILLQEIKQGGIIMAKGLITKIIVSVLTILVLVLGYKIVLAPRNGKITMTSTEIKNSFKEIGQLAVEEYNFTNVGKFSQDNMSAFGISIPFTDKSFLMTYSGVCKAGIKDISEINIEVNQSEKKVIVDLPNVEVLDTYIDVNSIEVYDQSFNPINQITVNDVKNFQANETAKAEELAIKNGLLDKAKVRMEEVVKSQVKMLLSNTEQSEYEIVINWK